jgi:hypothetical protein
MNFTEDHCREKQIRKARTFKYIVVLLNRESLNTPVPNEEYLIGSFGVPGLVRWLAGTGLNEVDCVATSCQILSRFTKPARNRTFALKLFSSFLFPCAEMKPDAIAVFPNFRVRISSTAIYPKGLSVIFGCHAAVTVVVEKR